MQVPFQDSKHNPIHPGEVLMNDFIQGFGITQSDLANAISVSPHIISQIVLGRQRISAETALRLARYFDTSEQYWMNLQNQYELDLASDALGSTLDDISPIKSD